MNSTYLVSPGLCLSRSVQHRRKPHLPLQQSPCPDELHEQDVHEAEDEATAKENRVVCPSIVRLDGDLGECDSPWQHPKKVAHEGLIQVPSWSGCKQDRCQLC